MRKGIYFFILFTIIACKPAQWQVKNVSSTKIALDASTQSLADTAYTNYLQPFKKQVDAKMNVVIGRATETMRGHAPESLLSNFSADVYRKSATDILKTEVDIAIVNLGGLRTIIPAGDITVRKVFELMPFENELVVVWLRGNKLNELCQYFASMGGEGISGLRMKIKNKKAIDITINGIALDNSKLYSIATNDYLAGGNDKMEVLAENEKKVNTGMKIRNMLLNYIKAETAKGNEINAVLDGRNTLVTSE
jgi:2',3'-cyclic-nucleotide 2'-phosphodiesterase (5'-nucleotidase family)